VYSRSDAGRPLAFGLPTNEHSASAPDTLDPASGGYPTEAYPSVSCFLDYHGPLLALLADVKQLHPAILKANASSKLHRALAKIAVERSRCLASFKIGHFATGLQFSEVLAHVQELDKRMRAPFIKT